MGSFVLLLLGVKVRRRDAVIAGARSNEIYVSITNSHGAIVGKFGIPTSTNPSLPISLLPVSLL